MKKLVFAIILASTLLTSLFVAVSAQGENPVHNLDIQYVVNENNPQLIVVFHTEITPTKVILWSDGEAVDWDPPCQHAGSEITCFGVKDPGGAWKLPLDQAQVKTCVLIELSEEQKQRVCETWNNPLFPTPTLLPTDKPAPSPTVTPTYIPVMPTRTATPVAPSPEPTVIDPPSTQEPTGLEENEGQPGKEFTLLPWLIRNN